MAGIPAPSLAPGFRWVACGDFGTLSGLLGGAVGWLLGLVFGLRLGITLALRVVGASLWPLVPLGLTLFTENLVVQQSQCSILSLAMR